MVDFRKGQKVIATFTLEDHGQDFIELDVLENGVLLGDSVIFRDGRLSLVGIGALDGTVFKTDAEVVRIPLAKLKMLKGCYVYFYETGAKKPLPWNADTFKYAVTGVKKPKDADRFLK